MARPSYGVPDGPCKGCTERHTACHGSCERYAKWKADFHKAKAAHKEYIKSRREDFLRSEECQIRKEKYARRKRGCGK